MRTHFTDVSVRALKPKNKQYRAWDTKTPGFGISVNGHSKSWVVMYGPKRTLRVLGRFPDIPLADARKKALVYLGTQPEASNAPKFSDALPLFLESHGKKLKESSKTELERTLRRHFLPVLGSRHLDKITHQQIVGIIEDIKAPSEALHAYKDVRTFFSWSVPRYIPYSPCEGLKPPHKYTPRTRVLDDDELAKVWQYADDVGYPFGHILKLLIITGQRYGEIASLTWKQTEDRRFFFPQTKNGRAHTIPYTTLAAEVLLAIPKLDDMLFPGRGGKPWNGPGKAQWLMRKSLGIPHFTIHDLRRTWASKNAEWTLPHVLERALNHSSGQISGVAAIYNRFSYQSELQVCYDAWEKRLRLILRASKAA